MQAKTGLSCWEVLRPDLPAVGDRHSFDDGQPQAAARVGGRVAATVETFEQAQYVLLWNADAVVLHPHNRAAALWSHAQLNPPSRWGGLEGVFQQVGQGAAQQRGISQDEERLVSNQELEGYSTLGNPIISPPNFSFNAIVKPPSK